VNFVNLIENFYAIRGLFPSVARRLALKVVLGHIETYESAAGSDSASEAIHSGFVEASNTDAEGTLYTIFKIYVILSRLLFITYSYFQKKLKIARSS
jgi:hypothetical protein